MENAAQAQRHASNPASVAPPVQHPSSNITLEPLTEGEPNPSSTDDRGAHGSNNNGSDNEQDQVAAEPAYDYAYVHETWKAREAEAAVDEARPETSLLELRKDRDCHPN